MLRDGVRARKVAEAEVDEVLGNTNDVASTFGISGTGVVLLTCSSPGLGGRSRMEVLGELLGVVMENVELSVVGVDDGSDSGNSWVSGVFGTSTCCCSSAGSISRTGSLSTVPREDLGRDNFLLTRFILLTMRQG